MNICIYIYIFVLAESQKRVCLEGGGSSFRRKASFPKHRSNRSIVSHGASFQPKHRSSRSIVSDKASFQPKRRFSRSIVSCQGIVSAKAKHRFESTHNFPAKLRLRWNEPKEPCIRACFSYSFIHIATWPEILLTNDAQAL